MKEALIIYNPAAGRMSASPLLGAVIRSLRKVGWRAQAEPTRSGEHATELARQAAGQKIDAVFAIGGDGTISQVARGLVGSETVFGILPGGTQNVLGKEFGLPIFSLWNWNALKNNAVMLVQSPVHAIDMGMCNGHTFVLWAGMGLDAVGIDALSQRMRIEKFFAVPEYAAVMLMKASQFDGLKLRVWADGVEVQGQYIVGVANNIRHYMGGFANLSPDAFLDDGVMDYWLLLGNSLADTVRHAFDLWQGKHLDSNVARRIRFKSLRIEADIPFMIQLDGDTIPPASKVEISVLPRSLKIFVPHHSLHLLAESSRRFT